MGRVSPIAKTFIVDLGARLTGDLAIDLARHAVSQNSGDTGRHTRGDLGPIVFSIFGCVSAMVLSAVWRELPEVSLGEPIIAGNGLWNVRIEEV